MKQTIRSFAFGLLTAGIIVLGAFYFAGESQTGAEEIPTEDMIEIVESEGYHVLTESEYIAVSVESDNENDSGDNKNEENEDASGSGETDENNDAADNEEDDTNDEDEPTTYTLTIESGVAPSEISQTLEENDIIDDADALTQYLEDEDYSELVQLGEFELSSDMDHHGIAETITN
ncbi:hypothetical protein [Lentibacillus salinarum]|uniref:YceG-like family protein n=1 Tax=Lentibacillus salinarum TaxID=446820 RepID=A0ABW3ZYF8_9BACI